MRYDQSPKIDSESPGPPVPRKKNCRDHRMSILPFAHDLYATHRAQVRAGLARALDSISGLGCLVVVDDLHPIDIAGHGQIPKRLSGKHNLV